MDTLRDLVCSALVEHMLALDLHGRAEVEEIADRILALVDAEYRPLLVQAREALAKQVAYDRLYGQPIMELNLDAIAAIDERLGRKA